MPQAINLTIKNAANVDKTFELITPASIPLMPTVSSRIGE